MSSWYSVSGSDKHASGVSTSSPSNPPKAFAGTAVCFLPLDTPPGGTVTLQGAHVGSSVVTTSVSNMWNVRASALVTLG